MGIKHSFLHIASSCIYSRVCRIEKGAYAAFSKFEGKNKIGPNSRIKSCSFGYGSYTGRNCSFTNSRIGRFCSIGDNVCLVDGTHPLDGFASTHPAFYSTAHISTYVNHNKYTEYIRDSEGVSLYIGNDVWIGSHVLIKGGLTVGDGAVIAMGSVVTKDIPPYAIVGGIPAKVIRYRFTTGQRSALIKYKWWNKPLSWIKQYAAQFENVDDLILIMEKSGEVVDDESM